MRTIYLHAHWFACLSFPPPGSRFLGHTHLSTTILFSATRARSLQRAPTLRAARSAVDTHLFVRTRLVSAIVHALFALALARGFTLIRFIFTLGLHHRHAATRTAPFLRVQHRAYSFWTATRAFYRLLGYARFFGSYHAPHRSTTTAASSLLHIDKTNTFRAVASLPFTGFSRTDTASRFCLSHRITHLRLVGHLADCSRGYPFRTPLSHRAFVARSAVRTTHTRLLHGSCGKVHSPHSHTCSAALFSGLISDTRHAVPHHTTAATRIA